MNRVSFFRKSLGETEEMGFHTPGGWVKKVSDKKNFFMGHGITQKF